MLTGLFVFVSIFIYTTYIFIEHGLLIKCILYVCVLLHTYLYMVWLAAVMQSVSTCEFKFMVLAKKKLHKKCNDNESYI